MFLTEERAMHQAHRLVGITAWAFLAACAHQTDEWPTRTGVLRFDEKSVTSPYVSYSRTSDGSWAGLNGERYERVGDTLRATGSPSPRHHPVIYPTGFVRIERLPNGLVYTPSYDTVPVWTFVTEDGNPLPEDIEIPLYLAARIHLSGVGYKGPGGCPALIFQIQDRNVAARWWFPNEGPDQCALVFPEGGAAAWTAASENLVQAYRPLP